MLEYIKELSIEETGSITLELRRESKCLDLFECIPTKWRCTVHSIDSHAVSILHRMLRLVKRVISALCLVSIVHLVTLSLPKNVSISLW